MITKTAIGNYLRKHPNGDVGMYRNGFKDGVQWAQQRLAAPVAQPAEAPDCRTCLYNKHPENCKDWCTNGDRYQPAPAVVLWRTEP